MGMGRVNEVFPNDNHWVISSKQRNKTVHKLHSKTVNSLRTGQVFSSLYLPVLSGMFVELFNTARNKNSSLEIFPQSQKRTSCF